MADTPNERRVIAYWDFENLVRSLPDEIAHFERAKDNGRAALRKVADFVNERGYVFINRSFANWPLFGKQGDIMKKLGVQVIAEVSVASNGKNGADIQLVIDAVQTVCDGASRIEEAVLLTGDSDFVPLAIFLRSKGIRVVGLSGSASASRLWREQCDEFFLLEDILKIPHAKRQGRSSGSDDRNSSNSKSSSSRASGSRSSQAKTANSFKLPVRVRRRMLALVGEQQDDAPKPGVNAGAVLQALQSEFPRFDYKKLGAERWSDLVKGLPEDFAYDYTDDKIPQLCIRTRKPYKSRSKAVAASGASTKTSTSSRSRSSGSSRSKSSSSAQSNSGKLLSEALRTLLEKSDENFVVPARLGHMLKKLDPKFDTNTYGHASLKEFIVAHTSEASIEDHDSHGYVIKPVNSATRRSNSSGRSSSSKAESSTSKSSTTSRRERSGDEAKKLPRPQMQSIERYMKGAAREGLTWSDEHALFKAYRSKARTRIQEQDFWAFVKRRQWVLQDVNGEVRATERPSREERAKRSRGNGQRASSDNVRSQNGNGRRGAASSAEQRVVDPPTEAPKAEEDTGLLGKVRRFFGN